MSGWMTARLDECTRVVSGATPSTSVEANWDGNVNWATPKDLGDLDSIHISETPRKITEAGLKSCAAEVLPIGSVLFSSRAPIGHVAITAEPMATNQGFKSFIPNPQRITAGYLYWWLKANRAFLEGLGNGATFKEVSKAVVSRVKIPLPPLDEQRRIAAILDQVDTLRRKRREALAASARLERAIFIEKFGPPEENPHKLSVVSFGDLIAEGPTNGLYKPSTDYGSGVPILRIGDFYDGRCVNLEGLKRLRANAKEVSSFALRENDIIINRVNSREYLGKSALIPSLPESVVFESNMMRIRLNEAKIDPRYCISFLQMPFVKRQILQKTKDAINQSSINQSDVKSLFIMLPPLKAQRSFANTLKTIEEAAQRSSLHLTHLDTLFAALQHRAFRGEL